MQCEDCQCDVQETRFYTFYYSNKGRAISSRTMQYSIKGSVKALLCDDCVFAHAMWVRARGLRGAAIAMFVLACLLGVVAFINQDPTGAKVVWLAAILVLAYALSLEKDAACNDTTSQTCCSHVWGIIVFYEEAPSMKQNKYDDPAFFANYSQMARSTGGLEAAGEWPAFREMLPDLRDKRVLDLGCGFGWHCRYAREQQASSVVGVDISEKMLARARESTSDDAIEYRRMAIEDIDFPAGDFDVVLSSLAFHYVERFDAVCQKVHHCLVPGGSFVFSVEHPIFTARAAQDWYYDQQGERLHWPVDHYQDEGRRLARFLDHDVVKYHRTIATYLNALIESSFTITRLSEPQPTRELLDAHPDWRDETRRPMFLLVAAVRHEK